MPETTAPPAAAAAQPASYASPKLPNRANHLIITRQFHHITTFKAPNLISLLKSHGANGSSSAGKRGKKGNPHNSCAWAGRTSSTDVATTKLLLRHSSLSSSSSSSSCVPPPLHPPHRSPPGSSSPSTGSPHKVGGDSWSWSFLAAPMEQRKGILELRDRMDKTLACSDIAEEGSLRSLVKKQILESSLPGSDQGDIDVIAEERAKEVSNFLEMLDTSGNKRSSEIHGAQQKEWKVKQDTDQLRVMYREGPDGTPFHTLLAEGFADGPIDVCTCVSWESSLYRKWFPQYNLPTFKISQSGCLKKVRVGEEISLIRMKVPWPVSEREALLHYFQFEYLKEDLVIVIIKTISDLDNINMHTHGFTTDGIPEAGDTIRMDVVGGFVLQRITKEKSFFRAVANMDIKLDFVPPWLINFMSRQLIGSGHKLYQKAVSTVAASDEEYKQALRAPLYARMREHQYSADKANVTPIEKNANEVLPENPTVHDPLAVTNLAPSSEIIEEENQQNTSFKVDHLATGSSDQPAEQAQQDKNKPFISPEVEQALGILDAAIAVLQGKRSGSMGALKTFLSSGATSEEGSAAASRNSHTNILDTGNLPNGRPLTTLPQDSREIQQAYSLPDEEVRHRAEGFHSDSPKDMTTSTITSTKSMTPRSTTKVHEEESLNTDGLRHNGFHGGNEPKRAKRINRWLWCLTPHHRMTRAHRRSSHS